MMNILFLMNGNDAIVFSDQNRIYGASKVHWFKRNLANRKHKSMVQRYSCNYRTIKKNINVFLTIEQMNDLKKCEM